MPAHHEVLKMSTIHLLPTCVPHVYAKLNRLDHKPWLKHFSFFGQVKGEGTIFNSTKTQNNRPRLLGYETGLKKPTTTQNNTQRGQD